MRVIFLGGLNTSDGLTEAMSSHSSGSLLNKNSFRIVTEIQKGEIRRKLPASEHYIVYPETIQGQEDLNTDMRRKTRAGGSSHWPIAIGGKTSLNSNKLHSETNSKRTISTAKTEADFTKDPKTSLKSRDIYSLKGFAGKNVIARWRSAGV